MMIINIVIINFQQKLTKTLKIRNNYNNKKQKFMKKKFRNNLT